MIACFKKEFSIFFKISSFQFYLSRFIKGISVFYSVCSSKPYCSIVQCIAIDYFMILDKFLLLLPLHYVQVLTSVGEKLSQEEVPSELLNLCKSPQLHFFVKQKSSNNVSKCFTHVGGWAVRRGWGRWWRKTQLWGLILKQDGGDYLMMIQWPHLIQLYNYGDDGDDSTEALSKLLISQVLCQVLE